jgi:hypothetical protein
MRDSTWVDAQYDSLASTNYIEFGTAIYFQLLKENPQLADYYALGQNVQLNWNGSNYSITTESAGTVKPGRPKPGDYYLYQNAPNPFNPSTQIRFLLPEEARIEVIVYNTMGQRIRSLYQGVRPKGGYYVTWNGLDDQGKPMASGIYMVQLITENHVYNRKMVLVR